jgi:hypothetical protein
MARKIINPPTVIGASNPEAMVNKPMTAAANPSHHHRLPGLPNPSPTSVANEKRSRKYSRNDRPNGVFPGIGQREKWRQQKTDEPSVFSPQKIPQTKCQSANIRRVDERVDRHLQQRLPSPVQPDDDQIKQAREENSMPVIGRKKDLPRQMPFHPRPEKPNSASYHWSHNGRGDP